MPSFAETFAGTLSYATKVVDDNYEGLKTRKPVTFPPADVEFRGLPSAELVEQGTQKVTLKSIRAPKFSLEYTVPVTDSVYSLKERLLTDPSGPLAGAGAVSPASIKLLIKSKVIADTRQLAALPISDFIVVFTNDHKDEPFNVPLPAQIYWGDEAKLINQVEETRIEEPKSMDVDETHTPQLPGLTPQFWTEVEHIAKRYVSNPKLLVDELKSKVPPDAGKDNEFNLD